MKWWRNLCTSILDLVSDYGSTTIPAFLFGILFGLSIGVLFTGVLQLFEIVTALGTLGAAFAAFWSVNFSRRIQRRRDKQDDEARTPSLQITRVDRLPGTDPPVYTFQFVNLSQQAIYISEMYKLGLTTDKSEKPDYLYYVDLIVPPYSLAKYHSLDLVDTFHIKEVGRYELYFYFNYAITGPLSYRLKLPITMRKVEQEQPKLKAIVFEMREQCIEGPLKPPSGISAIHAYIANDK